MSYPKRGALIHLDLTFDGNAPYGDLNLRAFWSSYTNTMGEDFS